MNPTDEERAAFDRLATAAQDGKINGADLQTIVQARWTYISPEVKFPRAISLSVSFNDHANVYQTAESWLQSNGDVIQWVSPEERAKAIAENSIWVIHWYPDTPVGFYSVAASTFDAALAFAMQNPESK